MRPPDANGAPDQSLKGLAAFARVTICPSHPGVVRNRGRQVLVSPLRLRARSPGERRSSRRL